MQGNLFEEKTSTSGKKPLFLHHNLKFLKLCHSSSKQIMRIAAIGRRRVKVESKVCL